jgi:hypothetical protein
LLKDIGGRTLGLESHSSGPLLESTGWLAAHRKKQVSLKLNPVHSHGNSLTGEVSNDDRTPYSFSEWLAWNIGLFYRSAGGAGDEGPGLSDA